MRGFRYFRPKSITWWAGIFLIAMGAMQAAGWPDSLPQGDPGLVGLLEAATAAVAALVGGTGAESNPAALMALGAGLIGLRDALQRESDYADMMADERHFAMRNDFLEAVAARGDPQEFGWDDAPDVFDGESPLPPGVIDPYGPEGSRG